MLALVVFVVGVVGMTAMQSRGIEAQRAAVEIREAERVGQRIMADLQSRGFGELVTTDFGGGGNSPPYEDSITTRLLVDMSAPPVDDPLNVERPGVREQFFAVYRSVDPVPAGAVAADMVGVQLVVQVMWVDTTAANSAPPATARASTMQRSFIDPADPNFVDWARSVELRTVLMDNRGVTP